jgi:hypothetical protein
LAAAIQKEAANEITQEIKIVPLRPKNLFRGALVQQPIAAENKYLDRFQNQYLA